MKSRDSLKNERVPVFLKKSFKLCIHSIKNIDAKLYLLKIHRTMEAMYKKRRVLLFMKKPLAKQNDTC